MTPDLEVAIPAPRRPAEPAHRPAGEGHRDVRGRPGWASLVEALDRSAAAMVAALEHRLYRAADAAETTRLRHQLDRVRRLEATTSAAAHTDRAPLVPD